MSARVIQFTQVAVAVVGAWLICFSGLLFGSFELLLLGPSVGVTAFAAVVTYRRWGSWLWTVAFGATLPLLFLGMAAWYLDTSGESPWGLMDGALFILFLAATALGGIPTVIGVLVHLALQRVWRPRLVA